MPNEPVIGILAGGASRRMGSDKASVVVTGSPLLDRMIDVAKAVATSVCVVGRVRPLGDASDVSWIADEYPGEGPLPAIATLLHHTRTPSVVVACDMPLIEHDHLQWLIDAWSSVRGNGGVVARSQVGLEPLFAIYEPCILPALDIMVRTGERRLKAMVESMHLPLLDLPAHLADAMFNVNTPDDLAQARGRGDRSG